MGKLQTVIPQLFSTSSFSSPLAPLLSGPNNCAPLLRDPAAATGAAAPGVEPLPARPAALLAPRAGSSPYRDAVLEGDAL